MASHIHHQDMITVLQPAASHSETSFPMISITVIGIIFTVTFLLTYYIFVIKCCSYLHSSNIIQWLSRSRRQLDNYHSNHNHVLPSFQNQGLHESTIQAIPILKFKGNNSFNECSVCLCEFEEEERIKMLPSCSHIFHIDCIDTWLQTHSNCPLCRDLVTGTTPVQSIHHSDDVFVIDVKEECSRNDKKTNKGWSLGDELIDMRGKDEGFGVEPIRRSFSMGSVSDRRLIYATVQEILGQNPHFRDMLNGEGSSTGSTR